MFYMVRYVCSHRHTGGHHRLDKRMGTESAAPMSNRQRKRLAEAAAAGPIPEAVTVRAGSQVVEVTKQQFLALWNDPEVGGETIAQVLSWYAAEQYQSKYWGEHYSLNLTRQITGGPKTFILTAHAGPNAVSVETEFTTEAISREHYRICKAWIAEHQAEIAAAPAE